MTGVAEQVVGASVKVRLRLHSTLDKTEEILNGILSVRSNID